MSACCMLYWLSLRLMRLLSRWPKEEWPTRTRCGTKSVSSARAAKLHWLVNPSPRRETVRTASSVSAASMPKSVRAATRPSQVRRHNLNYCIVFFSSFIWSFVTNMSVMCALKATQHETTFKINHRLNQFSGNAATQVQQGSLSI